jgi:hypothetical protein
MILFLYADLKKNSLVEYNPKNIKLRKQPLVVYMLLTFKCSTQSN